MLEDGGLPATLGLKVRDPFRTPGCTFKDPSCIVDESVDCSRQDSVYIITCNGCLETVTNGPVSRVMPRPTEAGGEGRPNYIGMSGTSLHARAKSHMMAVAANNMSNALARHVTMKHNGIIQAFNMKVCSSHRTVMSHYKTEAIYIEHQIDGTSLNDRLEGGRGGLVRMDTRIDRM